jgi:hypothetical protein
MDRPLPLTLGDVWLNAALVMILLAMTVAALIRWPAIGLLGAWFFITAGAHVEHPSHCDRGVGPSDVCICH